MLGYPSSMPFACLIPTDAKSPLSCRFHQRERQCLRSDVKLYVPQRWKALRYYIIEAGLVLSAYSN